MAKQTNFERLFGTPESTARIIMALDGCKVVGCEDCAARELCMPKSSFWDVDTCADWLRRVSE